MPGPIASGLKTLVAAELQQAVSPGAQALVDAIRERHGDAVLGVLFYGSCLRRGVDEGVHDFYVLVDRMRDLERRWWLAAWGALLPPNVYYLETDAGEATFRTKYAVITLAEFERCAGTGCGHPYIWARFAQPTVLAYARDEDVRERVRAAAAESVVTLVRQLAPFLPTVGRRLQRFSLAALWQEAFRRTYTAEFRSEAPETIRAIYEAAASRYDEAGFEALQSLAERGWLQRVEARGYAVEVEMSPARRARMRLRWHALRPWAKTLTFFRLLKTAFTFGDWLPYVLWKLERHSGVHIEPTPRQRRHPLVFGWPVIFRLLRTRALR